VHSFCMQRPQISGILVSYAFIYDNCTVGNSLKFTFRLLLFTLQLLNYDQSEY
jgi:hypothetical protein